MGSTLLVADCAYPFDYSRLPKGVAAILGYVGQPFCTPHVWTADEVTHVRNRGFLWAPIHTPPQAPFTATMGRQAGNLMVTELEHYPLIGGEPVFLDIEHSSWAPNPDEAMRGVRAWQDIMHAHGHRQAHAYLPWDARSGWGANWTNQRPSDLPADYVGWQYVGGADEDRYDLSVFRPSVFADLIDRTKGYPMNLDAEAQQFIVNQLAKLQANLGHQARVYHWDNDPKNPEPHANRHLHLLLTDLHDQVAKLQTAPVDVNKLAAALASALGPDLSAKVVTALGHALSNG